MPIYFFAKNDSYASILFSRYFKHIIIAIYISIHAPRVGSDVVDNEDDAAVMRFQSTLPVWGATTVVVDFGNAQHISIHAPRVGSDISILCSL